MLGISKGEISIKKKIIIICTLIIAVLVIVIGIVIHSSGRKNSVKQALGIESNSNLKIIHEEPTAQGSIVFMSNTDNSNKYLSTAFVSENIFGYKDLYSGVSSLEGLDRIDLTAQYFPAIKKTSLPIYFGVILNDKIEKVSVKRNNNSEIKDAKIIETDDYRIWLVYMNGFQGTKFDILGYSNDGSEHYKFEDTIPENAVQKPLKSPYE